jgi:hypothetical protein
MDMSESFYVKAEREAVEKLTAILAKPLSEYDVRSVDEFDPWELFPLYGSSSSEFDELALDVLRELRDGEKKRDDLAAEMFREILCNMHLCDYGTSPRVCFPSIGFRPLLPELIDKWTAYSKMQWEREEA